MFSLFAILYGSVVCYASETSGQKCLVSTSMSLSFDRVWVVSPQRRNTLSQVFLFFAQASLQNNSHDRVQLSYLQVLAFARRVVFCICGLHGIIERHAAYRRCREPMCGKKKN